jgi:hypothetical protein
MNFTAAGLARIKTPEFLLQIQQLPELYMRMIFLVIGACSDKDGNLVTPSGDEARSFYRSHYEQLARLMVEVDLDVIAMLDAGCKAVRCPKCNARIKT